MDESSTGDESEVVLGQLNGPIPSKVWRLNCSVRRLIVFAPSRWTVKRMWHELARLGNVTGHIRKIEKYGIWGSTFPLISRGLMKYFII